MTLPLAVSPSNPTPGFHLVVDLLAGAGTAGLLGLMALIITPNNSTPGDATENTEVRRITQPSEAHTMGGTANLGALAYERLFAEFPEAIVDMVVTPEATGDAAAGTFTLAGTPTTGVTLEFDLMGHHLQVGWSASVAHTAQKTIVTAAINGIAHKLFFTAADGSGGVVNLTARSSGTSGNDVRIKCRIIGTITGGISCTASAATLAAGTTEPVFTTALSTVQTTEYDYILPCLSSTEVASASSGNHVLVDQHINNLNTGLDALLQQATWASNGSLANAKTGAIGRNSPDVSHRLIINGRELPCEIAGWDVGDRMRRRSLQPNNNRIGTEATNLRGGSSNHVADQPTAAQVIDALNNGVSIFKYNRLDKLVFVRSITSHSVDSNAAQDRRCFDDNEVDALYEVAKDLRTAIPREFPNAFITKNLPESVNQDSLPDFIVEERDVENFIIDRIRRFHIPSGAVDAAKFEAAVAAGKLSVLVNPSDETQLDIVLPLEPFKVWAKTGMVLRKAS